MIRAEITGSDTATALGVTVQSHAPVLELCRRLLALGIEPSTPLEAWRGEVLSLRVRSIGEGARLTVKTAGNGTPMFALTAREGAGAPPASETGEAA